MTTPTTELGKELNENDRAACLDYNRVPEESRYAVFQRTWYRGRWYYDGYVAFNDVESAIKFRDDWLRGENPQQEDYCGDQVPKT